MTLIKSISGIRGTIGGKSNETLSPIDVVKFSAAFGSWIKEKSSKHKIVIGRDARPSGKMVSQLVAATLQALGIDVVDLDLSTTPTVEMAVVEEQAGGGIIITASHNPVQWNALKLLNEKGEFINAAEGQEVVDKAEKEDFEFVDVLKLGSYRLDDTYLKKHISQIVALPLVKRSLIAKADFKIVVDAVNSSGGVAVPMLLKALGVKEITELHCEPTGHFPHNPEPLPEHLGDISRKIQQGSFDLGIVVDPDVDRLALVCEDGNMFGEEYTLVAIADFILKKTPGATVSNLSSTRALRDVTLKYGQEYHASAVGEVNVVSKMKAVNAVIGGEGNGGIIYPELHYGRDALVGIALFLTFLAEEKKPVSMIRARYPQYFMTKNKVSLEDGFDTDLILQKIEEKYKSNPVNTEDGVKVEFDDAWVHLRKSNTEPIIRIYSEANSQNTADSIVNKFLSDIKDIVTQ